jgi:hypothetical protein
MLRGTRRKLTGVPYPQFSVASTAKEAIVLTRFQKILFSIDTGTTVVTIVVAVDVRRCQNVESTLHSVSVPV